VDAPTTVEIPAASLKAGANKIVLRRRGQGRVHWSAMLSTVVRPAEGKTIEAGGRMMSVGRDYTAWFRPPLPGEAPEERIAPGYEVVVPEKRPAGWHGRPLSLAGTGDKVRVTLRVRSPLRVDRVIVEDALPAGFEVVSGSAEGPFDREERRDDRQVFFFSAVQGETTVSYVLQAIHPGDYRALPTLARLVLSVDAKTWEPEFLIPYAVPRAHGVAWDKGAIWMVTGDDQGAGLIKYDAETGRVLETVRFAESDPDPHGLALHDGALYSCDAGIHPGWPENKSPTHGYIFKINVI